MKLLIKDLLTAYKLGVKTLYYHNTRDHAGEESVQAEKAPADSAATTEVVMEEDDDCAGGACKI